MFKLIGRNNIEHKRSGNSAEHVRKRYPQHVGDLPEVLDQVETDDDRRVERTAADGADGNGTDQNDEADGGCCLQREAVEKERERERERERAVRNWIMAWRRKRVAKTSSQDGEAQQSGESELGHERLQKMEAVSNLHGNERASNNAAQQGAQQAACDLEEPIQQHLIQRNLAAQKHGEGDGGVDVSAGNGRGDVHEQHQHEPDRHRRERGRDGHGDLDGHDEHGGGHQLHHDLAELGTKVLQSHGEREAQCRRGGGGGVVSGGVGWGWGGGEETGEEEDARAETATAGIQSGMLRIWRRSAARRRAARAALNHGAGCANRTNPGAARFVRRARGARAPSEQLGDGQVEGAPVRLPLGGVGAVRAAQDGADVGDVAVKVLQPVLRRLRVVAPVHAPALHHPHVVLEEVQHVVAGHRAAREEVPPHPVAGAVRLEVVDVLDVAENVDEQLAVPVHPLGDLLQQRAVVFHVLEHLDGEHHVERVAPFDPLHLGDVRRAYRHVLVPFLARFFLDELALRPAVRHAANPAVWVVFANVQRQTAPPAPQVQHAHPVLQPCTLAIQPQHAFFSRIQTCVA
ncbi:hypothetical protein FGB62_168g011 [Gracilaria domingensis]|nr:hypothetical protein FGB62_168g011 [Gracilaria domingensis]